MNANEYDIRLLHHNVQSLNNKLLDTAIMLTADHWLSEVQMNVLNIILDWLVILVEVTVHQEDHVYLQEIPLK